VEPVAEASRQLEDPIVRSQDEDVTSGIENGGTYLAMLKVPLHKFFGRRSQRIVQIAGDEVPDVLALYDH
jgi:hypothetical protein